MLTLAQLQNRKHQIVDELAKLGPMRKGSLSTQIVQAVLKDGTPSQRGPYTIYTFKRKGKTVSKRLKDPQQIEVYRRQIETFRRFQELTTELMDTNQRLADLEAEKKGAWRKSRK